MTDKPEETSAPDASSPEMLTGGAFAPIADIRAAVTFLTRLPAGGPFRPIAQCAWAFPVAGLKVGVIGGAVFWAAGWAGLSGWIAAFLTLAATALATGALHEDGLADAVDGLGAGGPVERKLEIMRDSRIGGYGALALMLVTGIKAACLASFPSGLTGAVAVIAVHTLSRAVLPAVMTALQPASTSGVAAGAGRPGWPRSVIALALAAAAALFLLGPGAGAVTIAAALACAIIVAVMLARMLGGYNGDTIGLLEQLSEIAIMLALLIAAATFNTMIDSGAAAWLTR